MVNEALFSVTGYVATKPSSGETASGIKSFTMRLGWTPRKMDSATGEWTDEPSSFATVRCYRKLAENADFSLAKGDPVVVTGKMSIREYDAKDGSKRINVDILATAIGHDLSRGVSRFIKSPRRSEESTREASEGTGEASELEVGPQPGQPEQDPVAAGTDEELFQELGSQRAESDLELEGVPA